ncbi:MAG: hypothetical protein IPK93_04580 [Solirubrobacterales bacterium]|nr:hypothetical protein [Solirubrobacterales bacterium]
MRLISAHLSNAALDGEIDTTTAVGGLWLGQDFLQSIAVTLLGPGRLVVLSWEPG